MVEQPLGQRAGSIRSRSATVMKQLRKPWNQNLVPSARVMGAH